MVTDKAPGSAGGLRNVTRFCSHLGGLLLVHWVAGPISAIAFGLAGWLAQNWFTGLAAASLVLSGWVIFVATLKRRSRVPGTNGTHPETSRTSSIGSVLVCMTVAIRRVALTPQCYRTVLQHVAAGDVPSLVIQLQNELVARHNHPPDIRIEWWSLDQHDAVLRLAESAGWPWPVRHRVCPIPGVTLSGGKSMAGTSIRTGLVWANDTEHDQRFHDFADAIDQACGKSRSIACYPTYAETHARGVLAIASSRACEFTRADVELLIAFADAVGAALARRPAA